MNTESRWRVARSPSAPGWMGLVAVAALTVLLPAAMSGAGGTAAPVPDALQVGSPDSSEAPVSVVPRSDFVQVYYFHRTARCDNCLKFEAYADEALRTNFAEELGDGRLVWTVLNMDDEPNEGLVSAYDVFESSLVVSGIKAGKERSWKKLEAIWSLVGDKQAFLEYVAAEVDSVLAAMKSGEPEAPAGVSGETVFDD